jgi:hypothetical protein
MRLALRSSVLALLVCFYAPTVWACSFQIVETTTIDIVEADGTTTRYITNYWAWVNCDGEGSVGEVYDPWPSGGTIGPPTPPQPPGTPTLSRCDLCIDGCWGEYSLCMSDDHGTNWLGFCGILCREACRTSRDICVGACADNGLC